MQETTNKNKKILENKMTVIEALLISLVIRIRKALSKTSTIFETVRIGNYVLGCIAKTHKQNKT